MAPTLVQFVPCLCRENGNVPDTGELSYYSNSVFSFFSKNMENTIPGISGSLLSVDKDDTCLKWRESEWKKKTMHN